MWAPLKPWTFKSDKSSLLQVSNKATCLEYIGQSYFYVLHTRPSLARVGGEIYYRRASGYAPLYVVSIAVNEVLFVV